MTAIRVTEPSTGPMNRPVLRNAYLTLPGLEMRIS